MATKKELCRKVKNSADFKTAVWRAYKRGYLEGQNERNRFLNCLKITNHDLWERLCELDRDDPREGIWLSMQLAKNLYSALPSRRSGLAIQLHKKIQEAERRFGQILKILESCKREK